MSSADKVEVVFLDKLPDHILTKDPTYTSVILTKFIDTTFWIRPEQVTKQALIRHISGSHDILNLFKVFQLWAQTSVHTQDFLVDQSYYWQAIEHITECLPKSDRVSSFALIVESVDTIDLGTLVITSQEEEVFRIFDLVTEQEGNCLQGLLASVDVVT